jgi:hypothetical protein
VPFKAARLQSVLLFGRAQAALVMANPFSATLQLARAKPSHPLAQQRSQLSQSRAVCCEARAHKPPTHPSPSFGSQSVSQSESVYISKISQFHNLPVWQTCLTTNLGIIRFVAVPRGVCGRVPDQPTPLHSHALRFAALHVVGIPLAPPTRAMSLLAHKERVCGVCCWCDCRSPTRAPNTLLVPSGHELGYQRRVDDVASCVCVW